VTNLIYFNFITIELYIDMYVTHTVFN